MPEGPYAGFRLAEEQQIEQEIIPGTRPFLRVFFKGVKPKNEYLKQFFDENIEFMNEVVEGAPKGSYVSTMGIDILSAEFESEMLGNRRGTINIADPLGVWPEIMANISRFTNGRGRGLPSVLIQYGWADVGRGKGDNIKELMAIIRETNFAIDENGVMNLTVHFIEDSVERVKSLKFIKFEDMFATDPATAKEHGASTESVPSQSPHAKGGAVGQFPDYSTGGI